MKKRVDKKPWGSEDIFALNEKVSVKILNVKPRQRLSLQFHKNRSEFWRVLDNEVKITLGKRIFTAKKGQEISIPKKTLHRVQALAKPARILEIAFGKFDKHDIVRIEDDYNRSN